MPLAQRREGFSATKSLGYVGARPPVTLFWRPNFRVLLDARRSRLDRRRRSWRERSVRLRGHYSVVGRQNGVRRR